MTRLFHGVGAAGAVMDPAEGAGYLCRVPKLQGAVFAATDRAEGPGCLCWVLRCSVPRVQRKVHGRRPASGTRGTPYQAPWWSALSSPKAKPLRRDKSAPTPRLLRNLPSTFKIHKKFRKIMTPRPNWRSASRLGILDDRNRLFDVSERRLPKIYGFSSPTPEFPARIPNSRLWFLVGNNRSYAQIIYIIYIFLLCIIYLSSDCFALCIGMRQRLSWERYLVDCFPSNNVSLIQIRYQS